MKRRKKLFVLVCCIGFIALLCVYVLVLFDIVMPEGETYEDPNNGITVTLPSGWSINDGSGTGISGIRFIRI